MDNERIPTMPQAGEERIPTMPQMSEERIPTMPQMSEERIPTMPQMGEERIPTMPQNAEGGDRIATMPQQEVGADGRVATMPQQGTATNIVGGKILLTNDVTFVGDKGSSFVINASKIISADSGESQIYGCNRSVGTGDYVARVLISVKPSDAPERRQTRDKVIKFLDGMSANENSHILPLIDHGTITINGVEYYVEIYPFCEGGDLGAKSGKFTYKEIKEEIVPAINEALHLFHSAGLVHRDVKPDNLYKYNGKVVIGDFGITCDLRDDGFATDKYKTGTLGYYAPELMSQAAIKASDYYSFGQTVWTLYSGEMMYRNILRRYKEYGLDEQRNQVNFAMLNNVYYGLDEIRKEDEFFEILIRGLLQYDPTSRFDYEKVIRWTKDDKSVAHEIAKFDSKGIFNTPFKFNGKECWDNEEVYAVLAENWDNAKELLYSGVMKDFYVSHDFGMASEIDKIVKAYSTVVNSNGERISDELLDIQNDVGLSRFLMLLNSGKTLVWRNTQYKSFAGFSAHIADYITKSDKLQTNAHFNDLLGSELLGYWYLYQTSKTDSYDEGMADVISNIRALVRANSEWIRFIAYTTTYYLFADDESALKYRDCATLEGLAMYIVDYKENICDMLERMVTDTFFYGFLFAKGYLENARYMIQNIESGESYQDIEMLFDLFDVHVEDKSIIERLNKFYIEKGPWSHFLWWKNNLGLYTYDTKEAKQLRSEIESFSINTTSLKDIRESFAELERLSVRFRGMFVDNVFLAQMGLSNGRDAIKSDKIEAYWHMNFWKREAPIGFSKYIGKEA